MPEVKVIEQRFYINVKGIVNTYYPAIIDGEILEAKIRSVDSDHVLVVFVVKSNAQTLP
jgi:hypothetical protein